MLPASQGDARLPNAPRDPFPAVVDAAYRNPFHSQLAGLTDGHGAFCLARRCDRLSLSWHIGYGQMMRSSIVPKTNDEQ
jgi:hypothetical protein